MRHRETAAYFYYYVEIKFEVALNVSFYQGSIYYRYMMPYLASQKMAEIKIQNIILL